MQKDGRNRNVILFLGPDEINGLLTMEEAMAAIEQGYREADEYPIVSAPRRRVHSPDGVRVSNFPGGVPGLGVMGSLTRAESVVHDGADQTYPYREHPVYCLWDSKTARLQGIMMGEMFDARTGFSSVMAFRTGATTGVGVKALAREDASTVGLIGAGGQAINKILAISAVRKLTRVKVFSRNEDNRRAFCKKVEALIGVETIPVGGPDEAMRGMDMLIAATNSNVPVFDGSLLEPGQHVATVVGSNSALVEGGWLDSGRRENEDETVRRADLIVTNHLESIMQDKQAGLYEPIRDGIIAMDDVIALGAVLSGRHPGRTGDEQITYHFNNAGTAAADLAMAQIVFERARDAGRGTELEIPAPGTQ